MTEVNKSTTPEEEVTYIATFTLKQHGMDGDVLSSLKLDPEPDIENPAFVHIAMSELAQFFLYRQGILDASGQLIQPTEEIEDGGLRVVPTGDTKH